MAATQAASVQRIETSPIGAGPTIQRSRRRWWRSAKYRASKCVILPQFVNRELARVPLGLLWRHMAECQVAPSLIVLAFNIGEQVASGLVPGCPRSLVDEFDLEGVKEALHRSVVIATGRPAHGRYRLHVGELLLIGLSCVLAAAIGVTDETGGRPLSLPGHHQRSDGQLAPHVIAYRPADDLVCGEIEHGSQVEPAAPVGTSVTSATQTVSVAWPTNPAFGLTRFRLNEKEISGFLQYV